METVTKQEIWEEIKKDSFLKLLAESFGCQYAKIGDREWGNDRQHTQKRIPYTTEKETGFSIR